MLKKKRIFIKSLPDAATNEEIQATFADYGRVINVDIKERKNFDTRCHPSRNFAYINVEIDDSNLQKCFKDFQNNAWHGEYVELQIAKENFLEQLKREREESNHVNNTNQSFSKPHSTNHKEETEESNSFTSSFKISKEKIKISPETISTKHNSKIKFDKLNKTPTNESTDDEHELEKSNNVDNDYTTEEKPKLNASELKRAQSVHTMIKNYRQQKLMIKTALLNVDNKVNNKIKFNDNNFNNDNFPYEPDKNVFQNSDRKKTTLFESDEESEDGINFKEKETFKGKEGKKLFELQARYKNDKRFILDERFIDENEGQNENSDVAETETIEDEKKKQFEILNQVLGDKVKLKKPNQEQESSKRGMLRFDPTQSDHLKYEIKNVESATKKTKRKREDTKKDKSLKGDEESQPNVSKEVFYKVSDDLKDTFQKQQTFSLLSSFGNPQEVEKNQEEERPKEITKKIKLSSDMDPFKYDSSNDEEEDEELPTSEHQQGSASDERNRESNPAKFWTEPFFFREDDYRFQDGLDFVKRLSSEKNDEFTKLRRDLKNIVKAKVKNNQRKNRPFKKKLGGNKKKKMIRMKKAMKR